jgi:hypothetical protein
MPNYDIAELCYGCFKLPILRAALRSSGVTVYKLCRAGSGSLSSDYED